MLDIIVRNPTTPYWLNVNACEMGNHTRTSDGAFTDAKYSLPLIPGQGWMYSYLKLLLVDPWGFRRLQILLRRPEMPFRWGTTISLKRLASAEGIEPSTCWLRVGFYQLLIFVESDRYEVLQIEGDGSLVLKLIIVIWSRWILTGTNSSTNLVILSHWNSIASRFVNSNGQRWRCTASTHSA